MNCPQCGSEVGAGARFCRACGASVPVGVPPSPDQPGHHDTPFQPAPVHPNPGVKPGRGVSAGLIVAITVAAVMALGVMALGGFLIVKYTQSAGAGRAADRGVASSQDAATATEDASEEPELEAAGAEDSPEQVSETLEPTEAGTVRNFTAKPRRGSSKDELRTEILDAARDYLSTDSLFFVNQLWVADEYAIGDIGAAAGGHRICVVWQNSPWRVVWVGDWDSASEADVRQAVDSLPPGLVAHVDWDKGWPKKFKFTR